jgi:hypothetical protein
MLQWGDGFAVINRIGQGAKAKLIDDTLLRARPCRSGRLVPTSPIPHPPIPY